MTYTIASSAEELLRQMLRADPLEATLIGYREYDEGLADLSAATEIGRRDERADLRARTLALEVSTMTEQELLTRSVILAQLGYLDDGQSVEALEYTVAAFPVSPSSTLLAYLRMIVLTNETQAYEYLLRLGSIPDYLEQAADRLRGGSTKGLYPVAHLVQMAIDQIDRFLAAEPCPLAIEAPKDWDGAPGWLFALDSVINGKVKPAFASHRQFLLTEALPIGRPPERVGLAYLPQGLERYRKLARLHTTTDRTPEDLHSTGLEIVSRVHEEFRVLGLKLFGTSDLGEIFARLHEDPALRWNNAEEILDAAESTVRRAEAASAEWFGLVPTAICALEAIPELEAQGAPAAYYMQPALDGSRPGTYYSNVSDPTERTTFDLESVAFHEAVPGHHFQISLALELPDLPMIRRLSLFTAYVEGWGLYAERLADEMGLYSSDLQRIGMLSADVWRASRLVVDTGMHAFGWSRQQAVDYLSTNTPVAPIEIESEIDRYIAYPGQALSYMTGRMEIQALRLKAQEILGDRFDIRDFHDTILGSGALPLAVLREVVDSSLRP